MRFEEKLKSALEESIEQIKETLFYKNLLDGQNVKEIYQSYLYHAYHYVVKTASFTPLAARRMGSEHLRARKWILEHSAEEMGHELMALKDLHFLGKEKDEVINGIIPIGVVAWMSFFHHKVTQGNPFGVFGVLYFLEGMAESLAPKILGPIMNSLEGDEKKAVSFFKEHGELDHGHLKEQEVIIFSAKLTKNDEDVIIQTLKESVQIKVFMLNTLMRDL